MNETAQSKGPKGARAKREVGKEKTKQGQKGPKTKAKREPYHPKGGRSNTFLLVLSKGMTPQLRPTHSTCALGAELGASRFGSREGTSPIYTSRKLSPQDQVTWVMLFWVPTN